MRPLCDSVCVVIILASINCGLRHHTARLFNLLSSYYSKRFTPNFQRLLLNNNCDNWHFIFLSIGLSLMHYSEMEQYMKKWKGECPKKNCSWHPLFQFPHFWGHMPFCPPVETVHIMSIKQRTSNSNVIKRLSHFN